MARIKPVEYDEASMEARKAHDEHIAHHGRITNMKRTLLHSVPAFHALMEWYPLRDSVRSFLDEKSINYFCHAISTQNNCLICSTFFRKILMDHGENPDHPVFTEKETLLLEFGRCCSTDALKIDEALFSKLKGYFSDEQIILLTAFAGIMIATNLINNALQVDLDDYLESYARR